MARIYDNIETKLAKGPQSIIKNVGGKTCGLLRWLFQSAGMEPCDGAG